MIISSSNLCHRSKKSAITWNDINASQSSEFGEHAMRLATVSSTWTLYGGGCLSQSRTRTLQKKMRYWTNNVRLVVVLTTLISSVFTYRTRSAN